MEVFTVNSQMTRRYGFHILYGYQYAAATASIIVGYVGEEIGCHYGWFGRNWNGYWPIILLEGQKYLAHVGNLVKLKVLLNLTQI